MRTVDKRITELIENYHRVNEKHKKIKKEREGLNKLLKAILKERDNLIETGNFIASLDIERDRAVFRKDLLKEKYGESVIEDFTTFTGIRETVTTKKRGA